MGKTVKMSVEGKTCRKLPNGQDIDYSEKKKWLQGFICPFTGDIFHNSVFVIFMFEILMNP